MFGKLQVTREKRGLLHSCNYIELVNKFLKFIIKLEIMRYHDDVIMMSLRQGQRLVRNGIRIWRATCEGRDLRGRGGGRKGAVSRRVTAARIISIARVIGRDGLGVRWGV